MIVEDCPWRGIPMSFPNGTPGRFNPDCDDWFIGYVVTLHRQDGTIVSMRADAVSDDLIVGPFWDEAIEGLRHEERWRVEQPVAEVTLIEVP